MEDDVLKLKEVVSVTFDTAPFYDDIPCLVEIIDSSEDRRYQ
jgi:hypothetical protein